MTPDLDRQTQYWSASILACRQSLHRSEQALLERNLLLGCAEALKAMQALCAMLLWIAGEMEKPRDK